MLLTSNPDSAISMTQQEPRFVGPGKVLPLLLMETHFMKFRLTLLVLMLLTDAVWNLVVSVATEDK